MKRVFLFLILLLGIQAVFAQTNEGKKENKEQATDPMMQMQEELMKMMENFSLQFEQGAPSLIDTSFQHSFIFPFSQGDLTDGDIRSLNESMSKMLEQMMQQFQLGDSNQDFEQFFENFLKLEIPESKDKKQSEPKNNKQKKKKRKTYIL